MDVRFDNLVYEVAGAKRPLRKRVPAVRILHGASGYVKAGESLAIMGPSGSGKVRTQLTMCVLSYFCVACNISLCPLTQEKQILFPSPIFLYFTDDPAESSCGKERTWSSLWIRFVWRETKDVTHKA